MLSLQQVFQIFEQLYCVFARIFHILQERGELDLMGCDLSEIYENAWKNDSMQKRLNRLLPSTYLLLGVGIKMT